jgi:TonB family protein
MSRSTQWISFAGLLATLCAVSAALAQPAPDPPPEAAAERVPLVTFVDPRLVKFPSPEFPMSEYGRGLDSRAVRSRPYEGWVILSMMVDTQGKPYEIAVVRSMGNRTFDELTVKSWQQARFVPATSDGKPVDSVFEMRYTLDAGIRGARPEFQRGYKALEGALVSGNRAAADAALQALDVATLSEDAYYGLAQYMYASAWGDQSRLESGLLRAVPGTKYLPAAQRKPVLLAVFRLQTQRRDYHEALEMWKRLQSEDLDRDTRAKLQPIVDRIERIRTEPGSYTMSGSIEDIGIWSVHLFKRRFRVEAPAGAISLVKLRCKGGFVSFPFDPELEYKVPERYGDCRLSLEGTPGTTLMLTQS